MKNNGKTEANRKNTDDSIWNFDFEWPEIGIKWDLSIEWDNSDIEWENVNIEWENVNIEWDNSDIVWENVNIEWDNSDIKWDLTEIEWTNFDMNWNSNIYAKDPKRFNAT